MLSSYYRLIIIVAAISIPWSSARVMKIPLDLHELLNFNEEALSELADCPANEVPNIYNAIESYCEGNSESDLFYYTNEVPTKCICADGYQRLYNGECISEKDCIAYLDCPHGEIPNLYHIWQATCDDNEFETLMPTDKCLCPVGKVRNSDGTCTTRDKCDITRYVY